MNNYYISLLFSFIAGLSSVLGFFAVYIKPKNIDYFLSFMLSFSLAVMLGISILDLIPEALSNLKVSTAVIGILFFILIFHASGIIFKLIDGALDKKKGDNLYKIGLLSLVALFLHNIPEGVLTFTTTYTNLYLGLKTILIIAIHNIPEGVSIAIPVYYATKEKGRALFFTIISGLSEPLAGIISFIFLKNYLNSNVICILMIFAASIMIYLSVFKLYPEVKLYNKKNASYLGFILGISISIITIFL